MTFERPPRRISTARVRPTGGAAETTTSRIASSSVAGALGNGARRGGRGHGDGGRAHIAARHRRRGARPVAEVREQHRAPAPGSLHVGPDRAVLTPACALGVARGREARTQQTPVPLSNHGSRGPVGRGWERRHQPGARQVSDDGPNRLPGRVTVRPDIGGQLVDGDVVAPVEPGPPQPFCDPLEHARVEPRTLDEEHVEALVTLFGEQQASCRSAVSPRPAGLLVVGLERAGHGGMADRPHVGLVDPHAEGIGGDDHSHLAGHEPLLGGRAHVSPQPRVVHRHLLAERAGNEPRHLLAGAARAGVHNRGQCSGLRECRCEPAAFVDRGGAPNDGKREIGPVEPGRDADRVAQGEPTCDVIGHGRRCGRRESHRRPGTDAPRGVRQKEVIGAEVVTPLRDAVRLVDHEQPDPYLPDELCEPRRGKALGRDIEQPDLSGRRPGQRLTVGGPALLRVDELDPSGRDLAQRGHLVLHQRDERRDHEREVVAHQRRKLVAQRLARAGGHYDERVAT